MITYITMYTNRKEAEALCRLLNIPTGGYKGVFTVRETEQVGCFIIEHVHADEHAKITESQLRKVDAMKTWFNILVEDVKTDERVKTTSRLRAWKAGVK